jgi:L-alanine-DL-glutamate epimerase-like enolase superfamily enzyme
MKRRQFLDRAWQAGLALSWGPSWLAQARPSALPGFPRLVDLTTLIPDPVVVDRVEVLAFEKKLFVRLTAKNGATGLTMANERMENLYSLLNGLVAPIFRGQDLRRLPELVGQAYADDRNYKYAGSMPLSNCIGHVEIAALDLLAKLARCPVAQLFGGGQRAEVPVYLSSLTRSTAPEEEAAFLAQKIQETGAKAIKIKVGGRMGYTAETTQRDRALLPAIRRAMPNVTIYVDANSSFDVKMGIETGRMLIDHQADIFEEPCKWEDYQGNRQVNQALKKIKLAGGEQDTSLYRWADICQRDVYDVLQPDLYYNGGMIKALQVAELAQQHGKSVAPHSPKADPLALPFLHLVSLVPNLYGFQEYPARPAPQPSWYTPHVLVKDGKMTVPTTPGLGVQYDDGIWAKAKTVG